MAEQKENPFADFKTEVYDRGELVVEAAADEPEPKEDGEGEGEPAKDEPKPPAKEGEQAAPPAEGEQPPAGEPPKKKTVQERINEVTRARRDAERVAETEKRRADQLERDLQEFRTKYGQQPLAQQPAAKVEQPPKKEAAAAEEDDPNAPKPDDFEYGELDSRFIRALAKYEADKRFNELRAEDEKVRQTHATAEKHTAARAAFEEMIDRGSKVHEDFYERVVIGSEKGEWPLSETLGELILASDVGNDIAYHLATNPEEADRVHRSSPVEQARYFGKLEAKFSAGQTAAPVENGKPAPRTPKAPPPIEGARGAGGQFSATADTDDFAAFEARVNSRSK